MFFMLVSNYELVTYTSFASSKVDIYASGFITYLCSLVERHVSLQK